MKKKYGWFFISNNGTVNYKQPNKDSEQTNKTVRKKTWFHISEPCMYTHVPVHILFDYIHIYHTGLWISCIIKGGCNREKEIMAKVSCYTKLKIVKNIYYVRPYSQCPSGVSVLYIYKSTHKWFAVNWLENLYLTVFLKFI